MLRALRLSGALTQAEIARETGLSPATISNIVRELGDSERVVITPTVHGGRRARSVALARSAGVVAGIDFGHRHLRVAIADLAHQVLAEDCVPVESHTADWGLAAADNMLEKQLAAAGQSRPELLGVGLGLPAPIDHRTGQIGSPTILPGWLDVRPAAALSERVGVPVYVDNDANLGALGEYVWGAAMGLHDVAYLKASNGLGAGLIIEGRIYRGRAGTAGEIGHTSLDERGRICRCGNRGCLESLVSERVLLESLALSHGDDLTFDRIVTLAEEGDAGCRRVIADAGRHIGVAAANLCNLLNPELVVVGGDLARAGEILLDPLRQAVQRHAIPSAFASTAVVQGQLGERAEVLGAVALALQESDPLGGEEVAAG